jgi:hypothetical protein
MGILDRVRNLWRREPLYADTAPALAGIWRDLHRAVRNLRRSPGFTATAVITLALGIGATTAIFTLLQQVMLRPLPAARPEQLWRVGTGARCCYSTGYSPNERSLHSWEAYRFFRAGTAGFEDLAAFQIGGHAAAGAGRADRRIPSSAPGSQFGAGAGAEVRVRQCQSIFFSCIHVDTAVNPSAPCARRRNQALRQQEDSRGE